jgi:hypothetical protein
VNAPVPGWQPTGVRVAALRATVTNVEVRQRPNGTWYVSALANIDGIATAVLITLTIEQARFLDIIERVES